MKNQQIVQENSFSDIKDLTNLFFGFRAVNEDKMTSGVVSLKSLAFLIASLSSAAVATFSKESGIMVLAVCVMYDVMEQSKHILHRCFYLCLMSVIEPHLQRKHKSTFSCFVSMVHLFGV